MASGGKSKPKAKGGSGSANDKRGGIAKAKENAIRGAGDRAGGGGNDGASDTRDDSRGESRSGSASGRGRDENG